VETRAGPGLRDTELDGAPYRPVPWSGREMLAGTVAAVILAILPVVLLTVGAEALSLGEARLVLLRRPAIALAELLLIVPPLVVARRHARGPGWLGLRPFRILPGIALGCLFITVSLGINLVWSLLIGFLGMETQPNYMPLFGSGVSALAWALFGGAVVAPFTEEVFFRGFLFAGLREKLGLAGGLLGSAGLFALVHFTPTAIVPIFVLGVFLALLYELSDSLWPGIIMHGVINALALTASFLAVR